jgi:hypothetical protein
MMFERLTQERWIGDRKRWVAFDAICLDDGIVGKAINRLAAYEDSGLTPEEVQELAQAKADGRLVVLPCKMGDNVYFLLQELDGKWYVSLPHCITEIGTRGFWTSAFPLEKPNAMDDFTSWSEFGKTVFLTREEAEKAIGGGQ